jgi:acyl-CoA synthetase (AMP-forming)/AMP-acid ligase II
MQTLGELVERNARCFPEAEAFVQGKRRLTHAQLAARARRLASGLYDLGLRRQDRVGILAMNGIEYCEFFAAAELSGYIATMLNFRLTVPELSWLIKDSGIRVLIFEERYASVVEQLRAQFPDITHCVCIGSPPSWAVGYEALLAASSEAGPPIRSKPDDYVYLWYTSGTTGRPKGVALRHRKQVLSAQNQAEIAPFPGDSRILQITPMFHVGGRGYVVGGLWAGATTVIDQSFDPVRLLQTVQNERITFTFMVAAMLQAVLDVPDIESYDLSSLRTVVSAAAPIPVPLLKRGIARFGPIFSVQYGCTEVGQITVLPRHLVNPNGSPQEIARLASVGHPAPHIDFRLLDDEGKECAVGTPGEVVMRSGTQLDEYWNNSIATVEAIRDGWYHTGDIGVVDEQGYVFLVDRKKDMIISGGENVYSREVESALAEHAAVVDVAVIGVPDPKWVEAVKGIVVLKNGAAATEAELIAFCRTLIAGYKCPKSIAFVPELPRLASGKINKVQLRERFRQAEG